MGAGSLDLRFDPVQRRLIGRGGSEVQGDTFGALVGLLASKWGAKCRQIIEFQSASNADGAPTYGAVYTDEADKEGVFYFRSTNGADFNHELGDTYDATNHYPATSRDLSTYEHKWLPLWSENSTVQGRGVSAAQRKMLTCGTRRAIKVGNDMLFPNLQGMPLKNYGNRYNDSTASGTEPERVAPWGLIPPLHFPRFVASSLAAIDTTEPRAWKEGDQFDMTVTFVNEDGAESKPVVPQGRFGTGRYAAIEYIDDFGRVTVPSTTASVDYYPYLILTCVPVGPPGTVERRLYRSPKVDSSIAGTSPDISDMRLWEIIPDNTTTTYNAYNGFDEGLILLSDDANNNRAASAVLFGKVWPKRGRYAGAFDGRTMLGYLKDHPCAIILCPGGVGNGATSADSKLTNGSDTKLITAGHFMVRVFDDAGTKTLALRFILAATALPATPFDTKITLPATKTLQEVVDDINTTLCTDNTALTREGGEWFACVAPGSNPLATADNIDYTSSYSYGDDSASLLADGTTGNIRCWNNAWPGLLYFTQSYMSALPTYPNEFIHTEAGPLFVNIGQSGSAFNFLVNGPGWRRHPPEDAGIFMGMAPLPDGCVVIYEKSAWRYQNRRGGTTGEDFDYRLNKVSSEGCIAWDSITVANGIVFWLSRSGMRAYGEMGGREVEIGISDDLYDARSGDGVLGYEIGKCAEAAANDTDGAWFAARVMGGALYICYRSSGTYPNRTQEMMFVAGGGASGLQQIMGENGAPLGWGTPWTIGYGALGSVQKSGNGPAALYKLGAKEESTSAYATGDGRIDRFDTGINDPGSAVIVPVGYGRQDNFGSSGRRWRARRFRIKHVQPTGSVTTVGVSRDIAGSSRATYTMTTTGSDPFGFGVKRVKHAGQSPAKVIQLDWSNDGLGLAPAQLFSAAVEVRSLNTPLA